MSIVTPLLFFYLGLAALIRYLTGGSFRPNPTWFVRYRDRRRLFCKGAK